jgi:PEP-CTERM motif
MKYLLWAILLVSPAFANTRLFVRQVHGFVPLDAQQTYRPSTWHVIGNLLYPAMNMGFRAPFAFTGAWIGTFTFNGVTQIQQGVTTLLPGDFLEAAFILPRQFGLKGAFTYTLKLENGYQIKGRGLEASVPEPGTWALAGTGLLWLMRRQRQALM